MGGALLAKGNAGVAAEFNFHSDPEAGNAVPLLVYTILIHSE